MKTERPEKSELSWDEETLIYVDALESKLKEIREFSLNENPHGTAFDNGYNQALENLSDIL